MRPSLLSHGAQVANDIQQTIGAAESLHTGSDSKC
jgi:hypothetical protein